MISFAYPYLLYLLLLLPIVAGLFLRMRYVRRRNLRKFGRLSELSHLMPDVTRYMPADKLVESMLILTVLILLVARPRATSDITDSSAETVTSSGIEVMICLDVSNSMLASSTDDEGGVSRLQRAKFLLEKLIDRLGNDKIGLIVFAGDAYLQLPITSDYISAKMFVNTVSTDFVQTQGTAIGSAINMAMNSFTATEDIGKAIIVITDGENFEDDAVEMAKRASQAGIQVDVIGLGGPRGARIPEGGGKFMLNPSTGEPVVTRLDEASAQQIAAAGKGIYVNGATPSASSSIETKLSELQQKEFERRAFSPASEQFPILAWLALILLVADIFVVTRKISWLRGYKFFSKEEGGKK